MSSFVRLRSAIRALQTTREPLIFYMGGVNSGFPTIPSFLKHRDRLIDSRAILKRTIESVCRRLSALLAECPDAARQAGIDPSVIKGFDLVAATELEFWVRTPGANITTEKLSVSQVLQESYWKRTKGAVRTALESSLFLLERYGLGPEMGHKEVGGVKATVGGESPGNASALDDRAFRPRRAGKCKGRACLYSPSGGESS